MKAVCFFSLFLAITITSCKKDVKVNPSGNSLLIGTWSWVLTSGGFAGIHETPASTKRHLTYVFKTDSSCIIISDTSTVTMPFHVHSDSSFITGHKTDFISFGSSSDFILKVTLDSLSFSNEYVDGFNYVFVRK